MAERQFGPYRLVRQIAVGGMAEIHLAKTKGLAGFEKYVALKMIHPNFAEDEQFIQMLVDEAKIAVQLTHGNIAQTFDLGRVGDTFYITMEYIDGADLYKLLRRGSEIDLEMPLDVCAFVGKEVAAALDYAHRKKDHVGQSLGIVHRDVSPQNVLVSYAGEVKLVDFGIAKAASKSKQTAIGVIKGKYYYMSPEQAWGDPLDFRSDIFSAGIVLYEMMTGQMLYLEEDLHKLLDMARRADIAPPSKLRKGIPPQLERIVMHALAKVPGERYQSAGDFATDLERFLHAYSPVFTAAKLSTLLRSVVGEPVQLPDDGYDSIEVRSGPSSTHSLPAEAVLRANEKEELRDENSVIFRVNDLKGKPADPPAKPAAPPAIAPPVAVAKPPPKPPTPAKPAPVSPRPVSGKQPVIPVPRVTRPSDAIPEPARNIPTSKLPPLPKVVPTAPTTASANPARPPGSRPTPPSRPPVDPPKPRGLDENTREMASVQPDPDEEVSGLLTLSAPERPAKPTAKLTPKPVAPVAPAAPAKKWSDAADTHSIDPTAPDDLENIGERTMITAAPSAGGFMSDDTANHLANGLGDSLDDGDDEVDYGNNVDATMITRAPQRPDAGEPEERITDEQPSADIDAAIDAAIAASANGASAHTAPTSDGEGDDDNAPTMVPEHEDDGPTIQRDFREMPPKPSKTKTPAKKSAPPPALAAKIHSPAVSELRKPRPSRRTPPGGIPAQNTPPPNLLQAIVGAQSSEPMPTPRPTRVPAPGDVPAQPAPGPTPPPGMMPHQSQMQPMPPQPSQPQYMQPPGYGQQPQQPQSQQFYAQQTPSQFTPMPEPVTSPMNSQMSPQMAPQMMPQASQSGPYPQQPQPLNGYYYTPEIPPSGNYGTPTPPPGMMVQPMPGVPAHMQPYAQSGSYPQVPQQPQYASYPPSYAPGVPGPHGEMTPGALYAHQPQQQPFGAVPMQPTITGQLRLSEGDELPAHYNLSSSRSWLKLVLVGLLVIAAAAGATMFLLKQRDAAPTTGQFRFVTTPPGADITYESNKLSDRAPFTLEGVPTGTRHDIKVELAHYQVETREIEMPKIGGEIEINIILKPVVGKLSIISTPDKADILIDGVRRGSTPTTLTDMDISSKHLQLQHAGFQPFNRDLVWPANGVIEIEAKMLKVP